MRLVRAASVAFKSSQRRASAPTAAVLVVLVVMLSVPGAASARIAMGRGIAGLRIGVTQHAVRARLGKPNRVVPPQWVFHRRLHGRVKFDERRRVSGISTVSRHQRTTRGVGPGTSLHRFRRIYPRARCYAGGGRRICVMRTTYRGRRVETDVQFRGKTARKVEIFVIA